MFVAASGLGWRQVVAAGSAAAVGEKGLLEPTRDNVATEEMLMPSVLGIYRPWPLRDGCWLYRCRDRVSVLVRDCRGTGYTAHSVAGVLLMGLEGGVPSGDVRPPHIDELQPPSLRRREVAAPEGTTV